jgi:hypothetical protein
MYLLESHSRYLEHAFDRDRLGKLLCGWAVARYSPLAEGTPLPQRQLQQHNHHANMGVMHMDSHQSQARASTLQMYSRR